MSERPKYQSQIEERIMSFMAQRFLHRIFLILLIQMLVGQALFRIEKDGAIRCIMNGVYDTACIQPDDSRVWRSKG